MHAQETVALNIKQKIDTYGFALEHTRCDDLYGVYEMNARDGMPIYITPDLFMQAFNRLTDDAMSNIEQEKVAEELEKSIEDLYNASRLISTVTNKDIRSAAEYVNCYFAIAGKLLSGKDYRVPYALLKDCETTINNIMSEKGEYAKYRAKGHYTQSETLKRYYRCAIWMNSANFNMDDEQELKNAMAMAHAFNIMPAAERQSIENIFEAMKLFMGTTNNISIFELAHWMKGNGIKELNQAFNPKVMKKACAWLSGPFNTHNGETTTNHTIYLLPYRYSIDDDIMRYLVDPSTNAWRTYPKAMDVLGVLNVQVADSLLRNHYNEASNWPEYEKRYYVKRNKFKDFTAWNQSIITKYWDILTAMNTVDTNQPALMLTEAWKTQRLNSSLAEWSLKKSGAVISADQPALDMGSNKILGYVEPNIMFWKKLKEGVNMISDSLKAMNLYTEYVSSRCVYFNEYIDYCLSISQKELAGTKLTAAEHQKILEMCDLAKCSAISISNIYTRNVEGDKRNGTLHEATGYANALYVKVLIDGSWHIARGGALSYYEFSTPDRYLNVEQWKAIINGCSVPTWMKMYYVN